MSYEDDYYPLVIYQLAECGLLAILIENFDCPRRFNLFGIEGSVRVNCSLCRWSA